MAGISRIFTTARLLGDKSSLSHGIGGVSGRVTRRLGGRMMGKAFFGFNIFGLFMWAEFLTWMRNAVQQSAAKEFWAGTVLPYAAGYEFGFKQESGKRIKRSFFFPAVRQVTLQRQMGNLFQIQGPSASRSGVYAGGRFLADIRAVRQGKIGLRGGRRIAGAETSRFFWGTLANPDFNVMETLAKETQRVARANIKTQGLFKSGALWHSVEIGPTFETMAARSMGAAFQRLSEIGQTKRAANLISRS